MAKAINKELQFAADTFLAKVRVFFPEAEIVEIKDGGKTVFKSDGVGISADDLKRALDVTEADLAIYEGKSGPVADGDSRERYAGDVSDYFHPRDAENEYSLYGYFDAVVLVYRMQISSAEEYRERVRRGELAGCPAQPETFYHNCWGRFGGWQGFLWRPDRVDPEEDFTFNPDELVAIAGKESVTQANWTYRTSTLNGYRASIAAGAVRGAPHSPELAWPGLKLERFLWPRSDYRSSRKKSYAI